ncbi:HNH endonuclease family protein [Microbacterium maritypicum]|uniref:GmrSD restriction endonucleases C-terminal domain-containing protein n=1 Tax=Microbacterium maritypicum MF109 TaxID=1333857 RepID=T5KEC6_MICMQ|nr:HNH endonuclease family protein [Microbacterium liquefaciens]EQM74842.1 hypothetical protein L687_05125 [Microbacterium maritypicum MF109]
MEQIVTRLAAFAAVIAVAIVVAVQSPRWWPAVAELLGITTTEIVEQVPGDDWNMPLPDATVPENVPTVEEASEAVQAAWEKAQRGDILPVDVPGLSGVLDSLQPQSTSRIPDYDRDLFGTSWFDVDGNLCDTRNDVLQRDMRDIRLAADQCKVMTGVLDDPYTGSAISFVRGEQSSQAVQIDHIIPLSYAWKHGAWSWDDSARLAFANDPANLLAVDGPTNNGKGDKGPARWMPPNESYRCVYATKFVTVAATYELQISEDDRQSLAATIASCS